VIIFAQKVLKQVSKCERVSVNTSPREKEKKAVLSKAEFN